MISNQKLFSIGNFDFRLQHLLIIGILALSISISILLRSTPTQYGFELFEFDPFYNFRATEYILENGTDAYFNWNDEKSWYPYGRNVSETSQVTLHLTAASFYQVFGSGLSVYEFTILFPLIIGSLTSVAVFAFVRVIGGTSAGLIAALFFSISAPIFTRGLIGWFKSEPLGLFFAFIALYLFVSGLKYNKNKISFIKLIFGGLFLSLALSAWGGSLFFIIIISAFYFSLPFLTKEKNFLIWSVPTFSLSMIAFSLMFERPSSFIIGYAGLAILFPTIFVIICEIIKKFSPESKHIRNCVLFLISVIATGIGILLAGMVNLPGFRYLNAVNPFLKSQDALISSIAEHTTTDLVLSFSLISVLLIFTLIGAWVIFSKKIFTMNSDMRVFALIIGIFAIYISSAFVRLELFASIAAIILGSIGFVALLTKTYQMKNNQISKIILSAGLIVILILPVTISESNWTSWADFPPSILSGASSAKNTSNDWLEATAWIKENTDENAVIASWWDYGYWITTLSDRTTIVDNATLIDWQIKKIAYSLIANPNVSWKILHSEPTDDISQYLDYEKVGCWSKPIECDVNDENTRNEWLSDIKNPEFGVTKGLGADYIVIYLIGERFYIESTPTPLYTLEGGGDESKKTWFAAISNHQASTYVQDDNISPTNYYMENSTLAQLIPYKILKFVEPNTGRTFDNYSSGLIPVYVNQLKFTDHVNDPFHFVFASSSFYSTDPGPMLTVLIYKINPDYQPNQLFE